jgi:hypothetical protein
MLKEYDSFMKNIKDNACGSQLLKEYIWLNNFSSLIHENIQIIPSSSKYMQVIGYVMAGYNMLLIHTLFDRTSCASAFNWAPVLIAFCSFLVNPENIYIGII